MSCDSEMGGVSIGNHKEEHALVRCQPLSVDGDEGLAAKSVESRLTSLENRFARVEKLLESICQKVGVDNLESA
jgi:hypothetical protein